MNNPGNCPPQSNKYYKEPKLPVMHTPNYWLLSQYPNFYDHELVLPGFFYANYECGNHCVK